MARDDAEPDTERAIGLGRVRRSIDAEAATHGLMSSMSFTPSAWRISLQMPHHPIGMVFPSRRCNKRLLGGKVVFVGANPYHAEAGGDGRLVPVAVIVAVGVEATAGARCWARYMPLETIAPLSQAGEGLLSFRSIPGRTASIASSRAAPCDGF